MERDVAVRASEAAEALPDNTEEGNEDDDQSEMERQLKQMQEQVGMVMVISAPMKSAISTCPCDPFQMAAMQRKLAEKKLKKASNGEKGSSAVGRASAAATPQQQGSQQENAPTPKQRKIVSQVDMFTKSSSSDHTGPRSVWESVPISEVQYNRLFHLQIPREDEPVCGVRPPSPGGEIARRHSQIRTGTAGQVFARFNG